MVKSAWLTPIFVLALALSAQAQGAGKPLSTDLNRTETLKATIQLDGDIDWVFRSEGLAEALFGISGGVSTIEYDAGLSITADLTEKVTVMMRLAVVRVLGGSATILADGAEAPALYDLNVKLAELWDPGVTLSLGTQNDLIYSLRGNGQSLVFAPYSGGSFGGDSQKNVTPLEQQAASGILLSNNSDTQQIAGVVVNYKRDAFNLTVALIPTVLEGGGALHDESVYAAFMYYSLDSVGKGSRFGVFLSSNNWDGNETQVLTIGGGVSLKDLAMPNMEIFVEIFMNSGDAGDTGSGPAAQTLDAGGLAFNLGVHYLINADSQQWIEVSFTQLSGDGDDGLTPDTDVDAFLSDGNVADLEIIEGSTFGFNVDTNLTAIKIMGGMAFTAGGGAKNNVTLKVVIGLCSTTEDIREASGISTVDAYGTEVDAKLTYWYSKAVAVDVIVGFLSGSDVLEEVTGGSAASGSENGATLFTAGISFKG